MDTATFIPVVLPGTDVAVVGSVGDFKEEFNMSARDTMTPLLSTPWVDASGKTLSVRALPGLRPELIKTLNATHPGIINPTMQTLLATCCGLADTELGHIDFTGCCFPEEPCSVFQPCLTIAIDDVGRRWIAEVGNQDLPGPVWCVFSRWRSFGESLVRSGHCRGYIGPIIDVELRPCA
jgi:hypothetical protein